MPCALLLCSVVAATTPLLSVLLFTCDVSYTEVGCMYAGIRGGLLGYSVSTACPLCVNVRVNQPPARDHVLMCVQNACPKQNENIVWKKLYRYGIQYERPVKHNRTHVDVIPRFTAATTAVLPVDSE